MVTKPKGKQPQAVHVQKSPNPSHQTVTVDRTEALIRQNGILVEELLKTEVWLEIISPLIDETIASVSGRKTNGRWHHGSFTRDKEDEKFLKGYQKCGMDINNHLLDFVKAKNDLEKKRVLQQSEKHAPLINPFLEDSEDEFNQ